MGQTGFNWLRLGPVACLCEHGNEPSGSIRKDNFDKQSDNQLFKEYPAPWSK
jgi:hypothetical protein